MRKRYTIVVHGGAGDEMAPKTPEEQAPGREGNVAMSFNTLQMWRGVADSDGRTEVMPG